MDKPKKPARRHSMRMNKWLAAAAVMAVSASLAIAMPQEGKGWGGHGGKRGLMSEKLAKKLNLTDTQKQQGRDLNKQFRQDNKAIFESAKQTRQEDKAAKDTNDADKVKPLEATGA